MALEVRFAQPGELDAVNALREQVAACHAEGRPDIFRPGFPEPMRRFLLDVYAADPTRVIVAVRDGTVAGYALVSYIDKPATPAVLAQRACYVEEFGVAEACRRQGIGSAMLAFIRAETARRGLGRVDLNVWLFNRDAEAFYEKNGFTGYRLMMESWV